MTFLFRRPVITLCILQLALPLVISTPSFAEGESSSLRERVTALEHEQAKLLDAARQKAREEGEIAATLDSYNKRPRKLFPGTKAFASERASYEAAWVEKIERIGTLNYPQEARGKLYGSLLASVTLDREGHVIEVSVERSSGQKVLDEAAKRIVRMGSPYGPLPAAIRQQYDNLVIIRTWSFTPGSTLETQ